MVLDDDFILRLENGVWGSGVGSQAHTFPSTQPGQVRSQAEGTQGSESSLGAEPIRKQRNKTLGFSTYSTPAYLEDDGKKGGHVIDSNVSNKLTQQVTF
jgi:hypothetical protein